MIKSNNHTFAVLAFRDSPYLDECIVSLKHQTVKSDIFISTSTPCESLKRTSEKFNIPLFINNNNGGIASDWSFAYEKSKTEYVTLAHQDDIYLPQYTESCLIAAGRAATAEPLIVFTGYNELTNGKKTGFNLNVFIKGILLSPFIFSQSISHVFLKRSVLLLGTPIACPTVMYNKECIGEFYFSNEFSCNMDWEAWLRLSGYAGSFIYVKDKLMLHRLHKDSQTSLQIKNMVRIEEERKIFSMLWPRPIAKILAHIYRLAIKPNITSG